MTAQVKEPRQQFNLNCKLLVLVGQTRGLVARYVLTLTARFSSHLYYIPYTESLSLSLSGQNQYSMGITPQGARRPMEKTG